MNGRFCWGGGGERVGGGEGVRGGWLGMVGRGVVFVGAVLM